MSYVLLVRHGESRWNLKNKFTGWVDVPLSERGIDEAMRAAKHLTRLRFDIAFTSHLERAHETLLLILGRQHCTGIFKHDHTHGHMAYPAVIDKEEVPVYTSWHLNERNYGSLQGLNKEKTAKKYGYKNVLAWRRSFDERPPHGESLRDVYKRIIPYYKKHIEPEIQKKKNVLIVAHGNSLRAIIKYIDGISDDQIASLECAPAQPFIYSYDRGRLKKTFEGHTFDRPLVWK